LLAGVGPADVHNRAPREIPLVSGGATVLGDGVLAKAREVNVVFCQFPPYMVSRADAGKGDGSNLYQVPEGPFRQIGPVPFSGPQNLRRTYRRTSFQLARLLANMGVATPTPLLARFSSPLTATRPEKRWLDAFYLDQPEEWDDPYRFFRW
jgi:hypothetical protein